MLRHLYNVLLTNTRYKVWWAFSCCAQVIIIYSSCCPSNEKVSFSLLLIYLIRISTGHIYNPQKQYSRGWSITMLVEQCGCGIIQGTIIALQWKDWQKWQNDLSWHIQRNFTASDLLNLKRLTVAYWWNNTCEVLKHVSNCNVPHTPTVHGGYIHENPH